jgi:dystroglycan 1
MPDNSLVIRDVASTDSGRYVCTAYSQFGRSQDDVSLTVLGDRAITVIVQDPKTQTIQEGATVVFTCMGISQNTYTLAWTRERGDMPRNARDNGQGLLTITRARPEDAGVYVCTGSNFYSVDDDRATLVVGGGSEAPTVRIEPRFLEVTVGEPVEFRCVATGRPEPTLEWTGGRDSRLSPAHTFTNGVFRLPAAQKSDEAQYYCKATNAAGSADIMTILYVRGGYQGDGAVPEAPEPESGPPSAVIDQPELKVPPGGDATLGCSTGRDSDVSQISYIEWTRLGGGQMPPGSRQEDGFLVIPNCRADYSGRYQCTITYVSGERSQALANLIVTTDGVQIAPTATIAEERQTVATGTSASIRCEVTGTPQPVITWSKAGGELGPNHRIEGNILRIVQAKVEDRGLYVCLAENVAGRAQATAIVEVERREAPLVELYPGPTVDLQQGGSGLFQCRATAGIPPPSIIWTRANNEDFTANTEIIDANGVIRFTDVTGAEAGSYVCTATNEVGSITATASVNIAGGLPRVSVSPQSPFNVNEGQRVSIECVADGDGAAPSVYWASARRVDTPVTGTTPGQGSAVLMMDRVTARDAGVYVCVATNRAGSTEVRFELRVVPGSDGPREGVDHISVSVIPQSLTLSEGQQADFRCTAIGNPTPQVSWEKRRGGVLPALHAVRGGRLIIQRVSEADAGEYACVAQSRAGRQEATVTLSVQVAPEVTVTPQSQVLRTGDRLSIQCIATGTPPVTVEWQRIGAALSSSASDRDGLLEIPLIMAGDAGAYKCVAVNDAGRAEAFADVELIVSPSAIVSPAVVERPAGSTVELRCETTGSPIPRVRWLKEGGELPEQVTTQNGVLTIYNARPEDSGRYVCQVTNEAGTTRDFAQLTVVGGPESPPSYRQQVQTVQVGDQVEINCAVTGTPRPVVRWVKVDGELPRQAELRDTLMLIPNIQPGDAGTYRCVASNAVGSVFAQVEIQVEARPQIQMQRVEKTVSVGSRVTLECAATGSPQPTIQWRKKDGFLPRDHELSEGVLVIPNFQQEDAGEYVCIASNRFGSAQGVIVITIGELVPGFQQNPQSYIRYPTLQDAYLQFDIEIAFKPETTDGLILYNGQFGTGSGDFMSFGLRDGRPELRFDMGSGPAIISGDPVALDEWHVVRIKRRDVSGMLTVNGRDYPGKAPGSFRGLDLVEDMYMGGVPSYSAIARNAGFRTGFVGGISRLEISGKALDIGGSALELVGITNYPVCGSRPCQNGGRCRPAATNNGYMCECKSDFSGNQCELIGERCFPGACGDRGTCYDLPGGRGYRCACPVGKTGERCERGISVTEPAFNRTSYIAYPTMEDALMQTTIELVVKPRSLGPALLLYNAAGDDGRGDFISLIISSDGHVEFRFDSGSGPAVIRSTEALAVDRWTTIVAERNEVDGSLSLNGGVAVKGTSGVSPGTSIGLNLKAPMYIGGVEASVRVNPRAGAERGFHGCISQMKIKGRDIDLINSAIASEDIVDCGNAAAARPCDKRPCENGGQCLERNGGSSYTCICPADFTGTDCESEVNICSTRNPCRNGAECVATGDAADAFYCKCPIGYTGRTCNFESTIRTSAQYEGTGYVELPKALLPHTNNKAEEVIELAIRTSAPDGLIFWHGQRPDVPGSGKDFLAIAVQDGHVVFSFELGSGTANVTSAERVDDGRPHLITATRTGKYGGLTIDGFSFAEGESEGAMTTLNAIGNIYLGGVPAPALMTGGRFLAAFTGCITEVYIQGLGPLDLSLEAVSGVNVQACSNS